MPDDKKYSLISVDVAPEEEVLRVDASGVHAQGSTQGAADANGSGDGHAAGAVASERQSDAPSEGRSRSAAGKNAAGEAAAEAAPSHSASQDSYQATQEDLEGPVPFAGLQKIIIAVVVLCLIGFAVYFGLNH